MAASSAVSSSPTLAFAPVFSDHAVLQRELPVPVWGSGPEGLAIVVAFASQVRRTTVREGRWAVTFAPTPAGGPHELSVKAGATVAVVLSDVWTGEVFVAGGQSNMAYLMCDSKEYATEVEEAYCPLLRYYEVPRVPYEGAAWFERREAYSFDGWEVCKPERVGRFSAVAYHFARRLQETLGVAVGIVGCSWGGTSASCWMPESSLAADPELRVFLDDYEAAVLAKGPGVAERDYDEFRAKTQAFREGRASDAPWEPPLCSRSFLRPSGLYRTMLEKVVPYAVRGAIWYQGETDVPRGLLYRKLFSTMIRDWRAAFGREDLPFLFVQLPSYADDDPRGDAWAVLREAQRLVSLEVPGAAMAVVPEAGEPLSLHPLRKKPVGERLARLALHHVYGLALEGSGPVLASWTRRPDGALELRFAHAGPLLVARGKSLGGFAVRGADGRITPVPARIDGAAVVVGPAGLDGATELRYAFTNVFEPSLYNGQGLPASSFRIGL
jgi:sialate O-acetylesterase